MHRALIALCKVLPLEIMYFFMATAIPFYLVFNHKGYISIYHYFRRRLGRGPIWSFFSVCYNHLVFGSVVIDKFACYAGKRFKTRIMHKEIIDSLLASDKGFVMVGSHVGNGEMAGFSFNSPKRVNSLVYAGEASDVMASRRDTFAAHNVRMVPVSDDMSHMFTLSSAIRDGEVACIYGDRVFSSSRNVRLPFMGADADFPQGPFALAASMGVPAISVFVMKEGIRKYRIWLYEISSGGGSRSDVIEGMADCYAGDLEGVLHKYPSQWFNFYEFWG